MESIHRVDNLLEERSAGLTGALRDVSCGKRLCTRMENPDETNNAYHVRPDQTPQVGQTYRYTEVPQAYRQPAQDVASEHWTARTTRLGQGGNESLLLRATAGQMLL